MFTLLEQDFFCFIHSWTNLIFFKNLFFKGKNDVFYFYKNLDLSDFSELVFEDVDLKACRIAMFFLSCLPGLPNETDKIHVTPLFEISSEILQLHPRSEHQTQMNHLRHRSLTARP